MKRFNFSLLLAMVLICALDAKAQTYGSASTISGTNYQPVFVSAGAGSQTNYVYQAGAYKTVTLGNIVSTNETVVFYYDFNPTNGLTPSPGHPGYYISSAYTNSFAAGTNGGSWSTTFNGSGVTIQCPVYLGVAITGTNAGGSAGYPPTNTIYVP